MGCVNSRGDDDEDAIEDYGREAREALSDPQFTDNISKATSSKMASHERSHLIFRDMMRAHVQRVLEREYDRRFTYAEVTAMIARLSEENHEIACMYGDPLAWKKYKTTIRRSSSAFRSVLN